MIIGIVDTETTGLTPEKDDVIEIGGIKVDSKTWEVLESFSALIRDTHTPEVSEEITRITGITNEDLVKSGVPMDVTYHDFHMVFADVDLFMAHNKEFDKNMLIHAFRRRGLDESLLTNKEWICSAADLQHPGKKCWTLSHMALDYGVAIDPSTLHRASDDCKVLRNMLEARGVDFEDDYSYFKKPDCLYVAHIKPPWEDGGVQKGQATALGFRFDSPHKRWLLKGKEGQQFPEVPFEIVEVER